jgi:hypothetical protein
VDSDDPFGEQEADSHGNHQQGSGQLGRSRRRDIEPAAAGADGKGHQETGKRFKHWSPRSLFRHDARSPCAAIVATTVPALGCLVMGCEAIHDLVTGRHGQHESRSHQGQRGWERQASQAAYDPDDEGKEQSEQHFHDAWPFKPSSRDLPPASLSVLTKR